MPGQEPSVFVPTAFRQDQAEYLLAAANAVLDTAKEAGVTNEEIMPLKEAAKLLEDSLDKALVQAALKGGPTSVGEVILNRIQRQLVREDAPNPKEKS